MGAGVVVGVGVGVVVEKVTEGCGLGFGGVEVVGDVVEVTEGVIVEEAVVAAVERGSLRSIVLPTKAVNPRSILSFVKERVLDGTKIMSRYPSS